MFPPFSTSFILLIPDNKNAKKVHVLIKYPKLLLSFGALCFRVPTWLLGDSTEETYKPPLQMPCLRKSPGLLYFRAVWPCTTVSGRYFAVNESLRQFCPKNHPINLTVQHGLSHGHFFSLISPESSNLSHPLSAFSHGFACTSWRWSLYSCAFLSSGILSIVSSHLLAWCGGNEFILNQNIK